MSYVNKATLLLLSVFLAACGRMTGEDALEILSKKEVYNRPFYAPIHIGKQVATLEEGVSLESYIEERYGILLSDGLVKVDIQAKSSWRNVFVVSLTEKGKELCDRLRSDDEHAFVAVFRLVPVSVDTLIPLENDRVECRYTIEQKELTTFGKFLEFKEGDKYHLTDTL